MSYATYGGSANLVKCCDCLKIAAPDCTDTLIFRVPGFSDRPFDIVLKTPLGRILQQTQTTDGNADLRIDISRWRDKINRYAGPYQMQVLFAGTNEPVWIENDTDLRQCFILSLVAYDEAPTEYRINTDMNECDCRPCHAKDAPTCIDISKFCETDYPVVPTPDCSRFEFSINVTGVTPHLPSPTGEPEIKGGIFSGDDETGVLFFLSGELIAPNDTVAGLMIAWINYIQIYTKIALPSTDFSLSGNTLTVSFDRAEFIALYGYDACDRNIALISRDTNDPLYPNTVTAVINKTPCC